MKRFLPTILLIAVLAALAVIVPVAIRRWSARLAGAAATTLDEARRAAADGDDDAAIERYRAYFDGAGPSPDPAALEDYALLLLRRAALPGPRAKDVAAAFEAAEVAIRQRPESVELRRRLGELKLDKDKPLEAREHLLVVRDAIDRGTSNDDADTIDLLLARSWAATGDHDRAAPILARLIGFDLATMSFPDAGDVSAPTAPPDAYLLFAGLLRDRLKAPAAADAMLERAREIHPNDKKVLLAYARMKAAADDFEEARAAAAQAVEADPADRSAVLADAQMKSNAGDITAATEAFSAARAQFPGDKGIFLAAAGHVQQFGEESEILAILGEGLASHADEPRFLAFLAAMPLAPESLGRFEAALDEARGHLPAEHPALTLLEGRILHARHEWYRAERLLSRSRALVPDTWKYRIDFLLSACHEHLGDHDLRTAVFQRYVKPGATPDYVFAGLAASQRDLGQVDAALANVRSLERRLEGPKGSDGDRDDGDDRSGRHERSRRKQVLLFAIPTIVSIERMQPASKRDWRPAETLLAEIEAMRWGVPWQPVLPRADLLAATGDAAGALARLDPLLAADPAIPQLQARRIGLLSRLEGIDEVRAAFAAMPPPARDDPEVLLALAAAERDAAVGDDRAWLEPIVALAEGLPDATAALEAVQGLAGMASAAGWIDEAIAVWQRGAKRKPDDFRPPLGIALLAARKGDVEMARAAAAEVAALDGAESPRSRVALAAALLAEARTGERGVVVTPSVPYRMPPKEAALLRDASQRLVEAGNVRSAWQPIAALAAEIALVGNDLATSIERFKEARGFGPDNAPLTRELIATLVKAGRYAEANLLEPSVAPAELGGAVRTSVEEALRQGDPTAAAVRAIGAVDPATADAGTLIWLGRLCGRAGKRDEAAAFFLRATETAPENPEAWLWLARFEASGGSRERSEEVLARGIEAVPEGAKKLLAARGSVTVGRIDDAERDFLAAVAACGPDLAPAAHTVDFYLQQGKAKQAEAFLEKLIGSVAGDVSRNDLESWAVRRLDGLRAAAKLPD